MKKLIVGFGMVIWGLSMSFVSAQDYCCFPQYDQCDYETGFNGLYIGGNIGVLSHIAHRNDLDGFLTDNAGWTTIDTDVALGLQVGYDWQCNYTLLGLVFDWDWANIDRKLREEPNGASSDNLIRSEFDWFSTIRARAGLAVCDTLVYITWGAAVARFETRWRDEPADFQFHRTRWGWTGGAGTEFSFWCNWSLGLEVLFLHFSEYNKSFTDDAGTPFTFGHSDSAWVGRLLLNYRFGDVFSCWCR